MKSDAPAARDRRATQSAQSTCLHSPGLPCALPTRQAAGFCARVFDSVLIVFVGYARRLCSLRVAYDDDDRVASQEHLVDESLLCGSAR